MKKFSFGAPQKSVQRLGGGFGLSLILAACGGGSTSSQAPAPEPPAPPPAPPAPPPPPPPPQTVQGRVFDGPISGATVFFDENGNGVQDQGEPFAVSDATGAFEILEGTGDLLASGGVDVDTALNFDSTILRAAPGSTLLSPLTTLLTFAPNTNQFLQLTGITELSQAVGGLDITEFDPFDAAGDIVSDNAELIVFLNQQVTLIVSFIETVAELAGQQDGQAFAFDLLARSITQTPQGFIGLNPAPTLFDSLSGQVVAELGLTQFTPGELSSLLFDQLFVINNILALNEESGASQTVQAILLQSIIDVESTIFDLSNVSEDFVRIDDFASRFTTSFSVRLEEFEQTLSAISGDVLVASRDGSEVIGSPEDDLILGRLGDDVLDGGDGDDRILGEHGDDILLGGAGDDSIIKLYGSGSIDAGAGDDLITLAYADVDVEGGTGVDRLDLTQADPRQFSGEPEAQFNIDANGGNLSLEKNGVTVFSGTVNGVEEFEFDSFVDITFTGSDADEVIIAQSADIHFFVSGGNDQIFQEVNLGSINFIADFSQQEQGVTITRVNDIDGQSVLDYEIGSISFRAGLERIIGSEFGDTYMPAAVAANLELGSGADTIVIGQTGAIVRIENFSQGSAVDVLDFSMLEGADQFLLDFDDILSRFREITEFSVDGEFTSLEFNYNEHDGFPGVQFRLRDVSLADLGPENVVLPIDVV